MSNKLTDRQRRFIDEYLIDLNATQAALRAGYKKLSVQRNAYRLLANPAIRDAITAAMTERAERTQVTQDRVIKEIAALAFSDMGDFLTLLPDGNLALEWAALPQGATRLIAEIVQDEYTERRGEEKRKVKRTRFKLHPKLPALDALAKHLGIYSDRKHVDVTGHLTLASEPLPATARWLEETLGDGTPGKTPKPRPH